MLVEHEPVASLPRLKELGLDEKKFGSCALNIVENIPNVGRVVRQRGCPYARECDWADNAQHIKPRDPGDVYPRPRHIKTRHVKPDPAGMGDVVIDNYCACWQWHQDLKRRNKRNGELAAVIGGEGDEVSIQTSKKVVKPDGSIYFDPDYKTVKIPCFPDPTENPAMKKAVFAARAKSQVSEDEMDKANDARRLGLTPAKAPDVQFVEMSDEEAREAAKPLVGRGSRGGGS